MPINIRPMCKKNRDKGTLLTTFILIRGDKNIQLFCNQNDILSMSSVLTQKMNNINNSSVLNAWVHWILRTDGRHLTARLDPGRIGHLRSGPVFWKILELSCISLLSIHIFMLNKFLSLHDSWSDCQPWNELIWDKFFYRMKRRTEHLHIICQTVKPSTGLTNFPTLITAQAVPTQITLAG